MSGKSFLSRDQILSAEDLGFEDVYVPEWGGTVRIRGLTSRERDMFEASSIVDDSVNVDNIRARLVALSLVDETGTRLFELDDAIELGKKSALAMQRVFERAQQLSGLTNEAIDELLGNSDGGPSDDTSSG
jgi:hypothetical protein